MAAPPQLKSHSVSGETDFKSPSTHSKRSLLRAEVTYRPSPVKNARNLYYTYFLSPGDEILSWKCISEKEHHKTVAEVTIRLGSHRTPPNKEILDRAHRNAMKVWENLPLEILQKQFEKLEFRHVHAEAEELNAKWKARNAAIREKYAPTPENGPKNP